MSSRVEPAAPPRRNRHELEFLPAALELIETPPSPAGRATAREQQEPWEVGSLGG